MESIIYIIVTLLTALGLGGILGAYFQSLFQHRKQIKEQEHEVKNRRYGAIVIQMLTVLDLDNSLKHTKEFRPDLKDVGDFKKEIELEFLNSLLYANDDVIKALGDFINNPNHEAYIKIVVAMRKDLWGKKTSINEDALKVSIREVN